jgi:hypothetical protein
MTHFLAMLQKRAGDIKDGQLHHSQHGQYEDVRLPHRDKNSARGDER